MVMATTAPLVLWRRLLRVALFRAPSLLRRVHALELALLIALLLVLEPILLTPLLAFLFTLEEAVLRELEHRRSPGGGYFVERAEHLALLDVVKACQLAPNVRFNR